jgi:NAD(P)H-dependent FMN reductase
MSDIDTDLVEAIVGRAQGVAITREAAAQVARQLDGTNQVVRGAIDRLLPFESEPSAFLKAQDAAKRSAE